MGLVMVMVGGGGCDVMCLCVVGAEVVLREGRGVWNLDGRYIRGVLSETERLMLGVCIVIGAEGGGFWMGRFGGGLFLAYITAQMVWVMHVRGTILVVFEWGGEQGGAGLFSLHPQFICFPILAVFDAPCRLPFS